MTESIPRLVVTSGEPAGIGPDICLQLSQLEFPADLVFTGDPELFKQRANALSKDVELDFVDAESPAKPHQTNQLRLIPISCTTPVRAGKLDSSNAPYVTKQLDKAIDLTHQGPFDALVTAPVHKGIINDAGIPFTGHTEWLAHGTGSQQPVMMLANDQMRVALATTHLPLSEVSSAITKERLEHVIRVLHRDLQSRFHIPQPQIRVCGLNPHAGEDGHLGHEEIDNMIPVINTLQEEGLRLEGPVPADTAFLPDSIKKADAILAMYHDQGLTVVKYSDFEHTVNITLGLPIIRTSVDHGTALELAGTGKADPSSLIAAVTMAMQMTGK